jgi:hypothetical protein
MLMVTLLRNRRARSVSPSHGAHGWGCAKLGPVFDRSHLLNCGVDLTTRITDVASVLSFEDLSDVVQVGHSSAGWHSWTRCAGAGFHPLHGGPTAPVLAPFAAKAGAGRAGKCMNSLQAIVQCSPCRGRWRTYSSGSQPRALLPKRVCTKDELLGSLRHGRQKCRAMIVSRTEARTSQRCGISWLDVTVAGYCCMTCDSFSTTWPS